MIRKRAILTAMFLPTHPLTNFLVIGSARSAALPKICLKRTDKMTNLKSGG